MVFAVFEHEGWDVAWYSDHRVVREDVLDLSRDQEAFALWPVPGVQINWYPGSDELLFDIDLREYTSQDAVDALCVVIARVGSALNLPIVLSDEADFDDVVVRFTPEPAAFSLRTIG